MGLNKYHEMYLTNSVLIKFIRDEKIKCSGILFNYSNIADRINEEVAKGTVNEKIFSENVYKWMYQGRKKILIRYLRAEDLIKYRNYDNLREFINKNFDLSKDIKGIENIKLTDNKKNLIDVKYEFNEKDVSNINKIVFVFIRIIKHKIKSSNPVRYEKIPLPVFVTMDFVDNEITSRVCTKSDLYKFDNSKIDDITIGKEFLEDVLNKIAIDTNISVIDKSSLEKAVFKIHDEVTKLPDEIIQKGEEINDEINNFIEQINCKLNIIDNNDNLAKEDLCNNIKILILKEIIASYEDKSIFEEGKYATSIGLNASGPSLSKLQYNAPAKEPVQCAPEYQNIRGVLSETERIKRNILLWKSTIREDDKIRSKLYVENDGYGIVSFEQYVLEEDIQNVLSKIREAKSTAAVY